MIKTKLNPDKFIYLNQNHLFFYRLATVLLSPGFAFDVQH